MALAIVEGVSFAPVARRDGAPVDASDPLPVAGMVAAVGEPTEAPKGLEDAHATPWVRAHRVCFDLSTRPGESWSRVRPCVALSLLAAAGGQLSRPGSREHAEIHAELVRLAQQILVEPGASIWTWDLRPYDHSIRLRAAAAWIPEVELVALGWTDTASAARPELELKRVHQALEALGIREHAWSA